MCVNDWNIGGVNKTEVVEARQRLSQGREGTGREWE